MKIFYAPYELFPKQALNRSARERRLGFLIKVQTEDFAAGYADCHPWKNFGDEDVQGQLRRLRGGRLTELLTKSLYFAVVDGFARENRRSLFIKNTKVRSHFTCADISTLTEDKLAELSERGYKSLKIKTGKAPIVEAEQCNAIAEKWKRRFQWRLDFNGRGGDIFLKNVSKNFTRQIEIVEDPLPFDSDSWKALSKKYNIKTAFDQPPKTSQTKNYKGVRVIKPARQSLEPRKIDIITNSMDHPVGQSFAFWEAQRCVKKWGVQSRDFGLKTDHLFKSDDFFREIAEASPFFKCSAGYGIGFDQLLARQKWRAL